MQHGVGWRVGDCSFLPRARTTAFGHILGGQRMPRWGVLGNRYYHCSLPFSAAGFTSISMECEGGHVEPGLVLFKIILTIRDGFGQPCQVVSQPKRLGDPCNHDQRGSHDGVDQ